MASTRISGFYITSWTRVLDTSQLTGEEKRALPRKQIPTVEIKAAEGWAWAWGCSVLAPHTAGQT